MDGEDIFWGFIGGIIILLLIGSLFGLLYVDFYVEPIREDTAQRTCVEKGHETFITYTATLLSKHVRALYCGTYEQRMIKEGKIDAYQNTGDEKGTFVVKGIAV